MLGFVFSSFIWKFSGNVLKQNENCQERLMVDLAFSAKKQADESLEPKLNELLAIKVKPTAMQCKSFTNYKEPTKQEQKQKLRNQFSPS